MRNKKELSGAGVQDYNKSNIMPVIDSYICENIDQFSKELIKSIQENDLRIYTVDLSHITLDAEQLRELHQALKNNIEIGYVKFGNIKDANAITKDIVDAIHLKCNQNNDLDYYPSDYEYAILSSNAYKDDTEKEKKKTNHLQEKAPKWTIHKEYYDKKSKYYGTLYIHKETHQIVLAHRGTTPEGLLSSQSSGSADLQSVLIGHIVEHQACAYAATKDAIEIAKKQNCHISVTGHSLGAWLAELSIYHAYFDFKHRDIKCVNFDSPGSYNMFKIFRPNLGNEKSQIEKEDIYNLPITTYLSFPNIVNTCSKKIGKIYALNTQFPPIQDILSKLIDSLSPKISHTDSGAAVLIGLNLIQLTDTMKALNTGSSHMLDCIIEQFDPNTGKAEHFIEMEDWPVLKYKDINEDTIQNNLSELMETGLSQFIPSFVSKVIGTTIIKPIMAKVQFTPFNIINVLCDWYKGNIEMKQLFSLMNNHTIIHEGVYAIEQFNNNPEKQFSLHYESHWRALEENQQQYIRHTRKILYRLERVKTDSLDNHIIDQVENLRKKYEIKQDLIRDKYIFKSNDMSLTEVKRRAIRLYKVIPELKNLLEHYKTEQRNDLVFIPDFRNSRLPFDELITRAEYFQKISNILKTHKLAIISGPEGSGKSTLAQEYGYHFLEEGGLVRFFSITDQPGNDDESSFIKLCRVFAKELSVDHEDIKQVFKEVYNKLQASDKRILLIIDNKENYESSQWYGNQLLSLPNIQIIITTTNGQMYRQDHHIKINFYTQEEAEEYVMKNLKVEEGKAKLLIGNEKEGYKVGLQPHRLSIAVSIIQNELNEITLEEYVREKQYEDLINKAFKILEKLDPTTLQMLERAAYLYPDKIPRSWLKENGEATDEAFQKLLKTSLLKVSPDKKNVNIHREVQREVQVRLRKNNKQEKVLQQTIKMLKSQWPDTHRSVTKKEWDQVQLFAPHINHISNLCEDYELLIWLADYDSNSYNFEVAEARYLQALQYQDKCIEQKQFLYRIYASLGGLYNSMDKYDQAINNYTEAENSAQDHLEFTNALSELMGCHLKNGYIVKAAEIADRIMIPTDKEIKEYDYDSQQIFALALTRKASVIEENTKDYEQSLNLYKRAKKIYEDLNDKQRVANICRNISNTFYYKKNFEESDKFIKQSISILEEYFPHVYDLAYSYNTQGMIYNSLGKQEEALCCYKKELNIQKKYYNKDICHIDIAKTYHNMGRAYNTLNNKVKALEKLFKALYITMTVNNNHPNLVQIYLNISLIYIDLDFMLQYIYYTNNAYIVCRMHKHLKEEYAMLKPASEGIRNCNDSLIKAKYFDKQMIKVELQIYQNVLKSIEKIENEESIDMYVDDQKLKQALEDIQSPENMERAKMLCFSYFCLLTKYIDEHQQEIAYNMVRRFVQKYPDLVIKIADRYPEYFVNRTIVEVCIKVRENDKEFENTIRNNTGIFYFKCLDTSNYSQIFNRFQVHNSRRSLFSAQIEQQQSKERKGTIEYDLD